LVIERLDRGYGRLAGGHECDDRFQRVDVRAFEEARSRRHAQMSGDVHADDFTIADDDKST
jgi:hypothetical protein